MAFSRNWDENFPPDTQAANLLGQDIRNFKDDIRERVAAISGNIADRPAVGDMITGWGAYGGNGVLYFATDTGAVYQWNGAAWVDVSAAFTSATSLRTTIAPVNVSAAVPPTVGQVLRATDATHATWQTASAFGTSDNLLLGSVRIQAGQTGVIPAASSALITFPVAFSIAPSAVLITVDTNNFQLGLATIGGTSATDFMCFNNVTDLFDVPVGIFIHWIAIGPA